MEDERIEEVQNNITTTETEDFFESKAITYDEEQNLNKMSSNYTYIYSGDALNVDEVFRFSTCQNVKMILVAGPHASGKTTLEVMLFRLFLEGRNRQIYFGGSVTIKGFKDRGVKILKSSGEEIPVTDRTLRAAKKFLHLTVFDEHNKRNDLLLSDFAGELFDEENTLKELAEIFYDMEDIIIVADGKKLCDKYKKGNVFLEITILIKKMISSGIVTKKTKIHIVCTKYDKIQKHEQGEEKIINYIQSQYDNLRKMFISRIMDMDFVLLSALEIEKSSEAEKMEKLILECMKSADAYELKTETADECETVRQFDKFLMRW